MDETNPPSQDPKEKKSRWKSILDAIQSPMDFLQHWSAKSPLLTVLAVVFLLQPVISTGIDLVNELRHVKENLDPGRRPVTKNELDIVNKKIDFLQQLILEEVGDKKKHVAAAIAPLARIKLASEPNNAPSAPPPTNVAPTSSDPKTALKQLQNQLSNVQNKLDSDWEHEQQKK